MKQLIISNYDMECEFQAKVLDNGKEIENYESSEELLKYGLYDLNDKWFMFVESLITKDNDKIKIFDNIIVCEDGNIKIYLKGVDY